MAVYGFDEAKNKVEIFPVGYIYMSVSPENPGGVLGGTWVAWGSGRVPIGVNASDGDFNTVEKTGGNKAHLHSTANHTLTTNEMPKHDHTQIAASGTSGEAYPAMGSKPANIGALGAGKTTETGGGQPHNHGNTGSTSNLQPYITCYMWKRTA